MNIREVLSKVPKQRAKKFTDNIFLYSFIVYQTFPPKFEMSSAIFVHFPNMIVSIGESIARSRHNLSKTF